MRAQLGYIAFITSICAVGVIVLVWHENRQPPPSSPATEMLSLQQLMQSEIISDEHSRSREEDLKAQRDASKYPEEIKRLDKSIQDTQLMRKITQERIEQYRKRMEKIRDQI
jgi:peptidoglycan hydrolase CwlO-like protein